ncbi:hypothetical protein ACWEQO_02075 [Streptomyces sp. NPDC004051]
MTTAIDFGHDTGKAHNAVQAAERRSLPIPQEIYDAASLWDVVMEAAHKTVPERPTVDDVPSTADELRTAIEERARAHRVAEAHRYVAMDYMEPVARRFNKLVRDQAPGWILGLQPQFLALTKALATQSGKLPALLDRHMLDWRDSRIAAAWEKAESASVQLDQLVADRQDMARAVGQDLGRDAQLFAVAKLTEEPTVEDVFAHKMRDHVGPALREWRDLRHQPVSRWLHLARSPHFTLELATPGEVEQRQATMDRWHNAIQVIMTSGLTRQQAEHAVAQALRG